MDKNARRRLHRASAEKRLRYSVRKFNVGVASVAVAAFMFLGGNAVAANTLAKTDSPSTSTEKKETVPESEGKSGPDTSKSAADATSAAETVASSETPSSQVADKAVKPEVASKSEAALKEATSQVSEASVANSQSAASAVKSEAASVAASTASSSETVAESTTAESGKSSIEKATSQAASLATAGQNSTAVARSEANSTLAAAQREVDKGYADFRKSGESGFRSFDPQTGKTTVTKENFLDYFRLNGSATYNSYDGIVTLTPDETSKTGNFSLKSKINMNQSFKLTGGVNLGDKTQERYGADGIGFAFHTGNTTDLGADGGNLGIGGLRNATGFKLDTFWNVHTPPKGNRFDTSNTDSFQYGWAEDPRLGQFGAWVNTTHKQVPGARGFFGPSGTYERWWAETDAGSAQRLDSSDLDGRFHRFAIQYDGVTKELTVSYESNLGIKQWRKKVSTPEELMSMVVTATTGNYKNLQQFQIKRFDFYQSASVDVRYEDEQGRELAEGSVAYPQGAFKGKAYTTEQKKIPGYGFIGMKRGSLPPSGTLADWGTNGTVTYVYRRGAADVKTEKQTVTRRIEYRYRDGQTAGRPALPQTVTQTAEFTRTVTGGRPGPWSPASQNFGGVNTPSITGFTPDRTRVDGITVNAGSTPGTEIVYYEKIAPRVTTETKDVTRTVAYEYEDGVTSGRPALPREVQQNVQFTRQVSEDPVTGQKTYGNWTPSRQTVDAVDTPAIKGFTPNKTRVNSASVSPTDPSWREIVSYRKNNPKVTTETKDVTRTVAYEYEDGVTRNRPALPQPVEQTVQFTRQVSEDPVTGQKTYGNWTPSRQTVGAVDSPEVAGFTPSKPRVNSASVSPTDPSWREIVSYAPATQRGTIVYRTDGRNGVPAKTLHTDNVSGQSDTPVNYTTTDKINEFKQQGYDLVSDGFTKAGGQRFDSNNNVDQTWEVVLTPRIETRSETKQVLRTIEYQYGDGVTEGRPALPPTVTQPASFNRQVSVNKVTGVETPGAWSRRSGTLPEVSSPGITGFTPDRASVPLITVTPTSPDSKEVVKYNLDEQRGSIKYVTDGKNGVPVKTLYTDPVTGKSGEPVSYSTVARIEQLKQAGYTLVSDGFTQPNGQTFDKDKTQDQTWTVVVTPRLDDNTNPAELNNKVTRTIKYQYADGKPEGRPALKAPVTQEATFTRTGKVNAVTGEKTFTPWTPATKELAQEGTPVVTGFVADKANVAAKTVKAGDANSEEVVQYKKLGSYVPNVPEGLPKVPNLPYPNDPNNPTKPGTDLPVVPHVPGTTPVGPDGTTPLTPKDPSDPSKGYNPPPIPSDPTQDTPINYVKDGQKAIITFVDQDDNNKEVGKVVESGKSGEPIGTTNYAARLKELTDKGYEVVNDEFKGPKNFDNDDKKDQQFVVTLRQGKEPVTDPAKLNSKVTRTIKYQYADGKPEGRPALKAPVTQEAAFTRTGERNRVTGVETFGAWTPATKELAQEGTPVVTGFVADKANVAAKTVKAGDANSEEVVQYKKLGSYVPNVPEGLPKVPNLPYPNDPNNPTKPGTDLPVVPHVPGTTPVGPDGTTPLTPKDPSDPSKGYNPPPIPSDPTQDTPINYVKDGQKAIITFVDQDDNNKEVGKVVESGKSGEPIGTTNYAARLKELTDKGYEVVNDEFKGPKNFDNDDKKDQQFVVTLRQGKEPVTDPAKLNSKVTRTIKYQYADGKPEGRPALKAPVTQEAAFTRTGERNRVTGVETFGAWTPATKELAQEATPVVTGFVADKANVAAKTVKAGDANSEEVVQYKKLGSYVPNVPEGLPKVPNLPYPNDPNNPTKPGTDLPVVPHVPGTTPVGPDGTTPLTPKDPSDPSKGYNPPPIPSDPTQDTPINYVKDGQKAIITFVDQDDNNKEVGKVVESGKSGEPIGTSNYATRLKELTDKGYEVVTDEFAGPKTFDNDDKKDQTFTVTLRQGKEPVTDPAKLNKKVSRTIKYEYADGETVGRPALKAPVTQEAAFTRTGERNRVTGVETFGAWTPATKELAQEATPVVTGFVADKANVAAKTVKAGDANSEEVVQYKKLGSYVPNVPEGLPKVPNLPYPNDPNNPTKPGTDLPVVPHVPGTTPVGPDGTTPLTPKDPSDPSKGYNPPPIPSDPTQDTPINYVKDGQKAIITFVDQDDNNKEVGKVVESGKSGEPIGTSNYATRLKELTDKGYEVVNDEFKGPKTFDNDDKKDQQFVVTLRQGKEPVTDPAKLNSKVTRTIKYQYADGKPEGRPALKAPVTQEAAFTRTGERNRVTGVETFGAWTPATKELAQEATPVVTGFVADKANVAAKTVKAGDANSEEVVQYKKLGSYVPNVPEGLPKVPNLPYPNDPNNPTKPGTDLPVVPHVPGTTPVGPDGTTPLTPKDPSDPSKGYNPPPIPSDPTQDTPINYVKDGQKAIITFVDQDDNNKEVGKVVESGKSGEPIGTSNYATRLKELTDKGYEVVNDEFKGPKTFDNDDKKDQQFVVTLRQGKEPVTDPAKLNSKVTRTIKYQYADGKPEGRPALKAPVTQEAAFTRTGERNRVTGVETFGAWTPATKELAQEATPVVTGFVADKANVAAKTVKAGDANSEEVVQYKKLGSYVPNVPEGLPKVPNLPYPNDPTDPSKPGTDLPVVPYVPGTTPVGPDGTTPLTPKDPSDPSKGYNPPPVPSDPTKDTPINYVKDGQKAIISFVDQTDGNKELTKVVESGKSGEPIGTSNYATRLKELTDKGYEVVTDEFAGPKTFDNDDKKDQTFTVTLRQGKEPVTDPAKLNKKVSRTIKYEYADGETAGRPALKAPVTQEAAFTRTGERNRVTGVETFGAWTPATKELAQEATPVVTGFVADKANVAAKTVTPDDKDSEETVKYSKLGSYVPNVPEGLPKVPNLPYPNDPTDPSKPGTDLPVVPYVPGTTPVGPDGTTPLTPKDPSDPSKGYNPPPVPSDPTKDTPINYVKDGQKAIISFVDQTDGNKELTKVVESGKSGEPIGTSNYATRLKELTDKGYEVVTDEFAGPKTFDNDDKKDQTFTVTLRQGKEPVTDPAKLNSKVTRTIKYQYADGKPEGRPALKAPVTQEAAFTRTGERNRVTGVETFGAWTPATKELAQEATPVVTGFVADKANVAAKTVKAGDANSEEVVQYKKLGSYVPNVPEGLPKVPNLPYPNDPTDPSKPGTDLPVVPYVPGTTPVGPDGTTPLTPKDPSDPSKGYNPPPVPSDPTKDTPINYVKDGQKAIISFVDQTDGNKELTKVVESGKSGEPIGTSNYATRLKELTDKGYEVVTDEFAGPKTFDNDDKKDQTFTVTLRQGKEPVTDPAKLNKKVSRTIKYEYADGETAGRPALKAPVTQEAAFTRTGERNRVTGVETFGAWTPATKELAQEATPVVTGFVADKANVAAKTVTPDDKDSEETVKYSKLGSYVPNVPEGLPKVPNLPYPNDPTDPSKPGTDLPVVPYVPGTTPVGPDGTTPLTPKDPSDPSKGYNPPPVPSDPTKDTPINYVKDGQKAIISFVDQTDGNKELTKVVESGKSGEPIGTSNYATRLKELTDKGYEVVTDEFAGPKTFDNDDKKDQTFTVTLRQGKEPVTDPAKLNKKVSRTIKYEYADGETAGRPALKAPVTQEAAFTRTGERNRVTGVETFGAWTPATKELAQEATPVVTGFVADKANVAAKTVTPDDKDSEETVKYSKLGSYVPNVPEGLPKVPNLPYPNDPTDPSKPGTDLPVVPYVPGTTPVGPDGTTPLTPKDPSDPSKGYNPPPVPSDPTKDTPINYVKDGQKAIISFVDQTDGNKELTKVVESGKSGEPIGTSNYATRLKELTDKGYEVVTDEFAGPKTFDNDDKKDQTFTVTLRQGKEPVTDPAKLNKKVSRTIKYEYADGETVGRPALKAPVTQEAAFTRTGERNRVTGVETFGAWTPATKELAQEATPVVTGFVADKANVAAKTVTPDDKDSEETVKYSKLGSYVPNVPEGLPKVPNLPYPNDPTDPSKPGTDLPVVPYVPGTTPVGPDGTTPLTPKDPSDPSKGYNPPPVPSDPTKDTPINYVKDGQKAIISFVDQTDGNKELTKVVESGKSGEPIGTSNYATRLKELTDKGYEVVTDEFAGPKTFDNDDKKDQTFTVTLRQGKEPVTDPAKLNKKVSRTIKYEYADGETAGRPALKAPVTQEAAFTRTGERNRVTGVETFGAWTPATKELAQEATPVVTGFVADKANVAAKTVTPDDKDSEETVKYSKLGSYVPNVPEGLPKVPNLPYPNDPTDPSKPGTDLPVVPYVPGTTPVGPDGTTPLTPKDPSDPSKGYNPPPVPSDPTKDTPINYVKDGQKAIISFVDQTDGNKELTKVVESGKSGEPIGTSNYATRLKELTDKGYEVVTDEFAGPKTFDNDDKKDQTFTVTLRQGKEPVTDPAKLNKKVSRTIKYEYADGETAGRPALKAPVTQEAAFTRTGERNRVTGVETFGAWTPATKELAQEATPVVTGFVADKANVAAKTVTPDDKDSEETVKYSKLGSYVPNVPEGLPKVPNLPYPNDPTDPSKPGTDLPVVPYVPGTTPVGPDGTTPLTPKDPSDPSKGYNPPPVPSDPTKDTPINYVKDGQKAIISFVDQTDGNKELTKVVESGKSGEPIGTSNYATRLKELTDKGYEVVTDEFAGPKTFDNDDKKDQTFTVTLRQGKEPVTDPAKLNKKVSRTIKYEYADGETAGRPALKAPVTQEAAFTRTGERNRVTGVETFGAWTPATKELAQEATPVVTGFVADKANVAAKTVTPDDKDSEETVKYSKLGSYVPNVPEGLPKVPNLPYPNDPTDPSKPGTDLPVVPYVPGTTPVGPDGTTPLTPKDPSDPSKGYNPPPVPSDPTKDTPINYVKDGQKAIISFVDQTDGNKELTKVVESGKSGEPIGTSNYATRLKELTDKGYEVVTDEFAGPKTFDNDDKKDQTFTVTLRQGKEPVTDPAKLNKKVSRTIKYEYADGETAGRPALKAPVTQEAAFTRTGERNRVTGVETFGAWTPATKELAQEATPVVTGFVADKANVAAKTVTPDDKDSEETVKYSKLGSYVPNVPEGLPKVPNLPYPNDPTDPSKPGTDLPVVPYVPGTTPVGPDGTTPLTPKDPSDPSKGYNPPPVPSDPTKDTPINYVKDGQKAIISFVDQTDGNKELTKVVESGKSGEPIGTSNYATRLKELTDKGYEVVTDEFAGPKTFDNDDKKDQTFTVTLRQGKEPVTDPAKLNKKVSRTIKYEYADGETAGRPALKAPVTQEAAFTRTGERNRVTGVETFGAWTPATKELAQEATPVVTGFVADKANVAAKTVTPDDKDSEETVKYSKLGSYVPNVPEGLPKVPNLPYPNDPTDPSKPGTDLPVVPYVPGTTPVGPDGTTPLTPKDPSDPSKGYNPPPVPSDPTKDTPINYVKDGQKAIISFVDQTDGNKELTKVVESGKSGEPIGTSNYATRLKELTDKGYEVVTDEFAGPKTFDNDDKKDQTFTVTLRQAVVPFDPNNPPKPNDPMDPKNPDGPKWTDDKIKSAQQEAVKELSRTIKYVYEDGKEAAPSFTDSAKFTRILKINVVTKEIVEKGAWTSQDDVIKGQTSPDIKGYVADKASVADVKVTADSAKPADEVVTYKKADQKATITFVDQAKKELAKISEGGKSGEPISRDQYLAKLKELTNQGYKVVNDEFKDPQNFDDDASKDQNFTVQLEESVVPFDPNNPPKPNDPMDPKNPDGPKWTDDKIKSAQQEAVKELSRTIKYVYEDGKEAAPSFTDSAKFTRILKVNVVTKEIVEKGPWTSQDDVIKGQTSPDIKGYVADKASVADVKVTADSAKPADEVVTYKKADQKATITFVDQAKKELAKVSEGGKSGEPISRDQYLAKLKELTNQGYKVVKDEFKDPQNFDDDASKDQNFTVQLEESVVPFDPNNPPKPNDPMDPKNPDGPKWTDDKIKSAQQEAVKELSRTITYVYEDGKQAAPSFTDSAKFTRILKVNVVTKEIVEKGPWTSQDDVIKGQTSPDIKGYVADKASVADVKVTADSAKPADEVVTYKKADQKATITFVDQAKKELAKISEGGKSGEPISRDQYLAKLKELTNQGYKVVKDEFKDPQNFDDDASKDQNFTVQLEESVVPFDPNNPPKPNDPMDPKNPDGPKWTDDKIKSAQQEAVKELSRTITYVYEDGKQAAPSFTDSAKFTRILKVNVVTKEIVEKGPWTSQDDVIKGQTSPDIKGYVADKASVADVKVTADSAKPADEVVTYKKAEVPPTPVPPTPAPAPNKPVEPRVPRTAVLPNTGEESSSAAVLGLGIAAALAGISLIKPRLREEEE